MYVATRGGEKAISHAHLLMKRQGAPSEGTERITPQQVIDQMWLAVSRVMTEGSVYDPDVCARALMQAQGDTVEAIFLVRAYRTTLPRFGISEPLESTEMLVSRRISAAFKDLPGGQILGPTFDYSHRLIDFAESDIAPSETKELRSEDLFDIEGEPHVEREIPRVLDVLDREGLVEPIEPAMAELDYDLTRHPLSFPVSRATRLQALARGDEGFLLSLGYSTQRGFGSTHPFAGEVRNGMVDLVFQPDELDFPIVIGELEVTECEMINQFVGTPTTPPQFTRGYGLVFGQGERKAMSMALVDRAMRSEELGEPVGTAPAADVEFVLSHADNLEASGFVQHLKLPHYVDFQSELVMLRELREAWEKEADE